MLASVDLGKLAEDIKQAVQTLIENQDVDLQGHSVSCNLVDIEVRLSVVVGDQATQSRDMKLGYVLKGGGVVQIHISPK
jgi:hypothetical protein